jgi:nucleotide-binding universal stress UspA family protein
VHDCAESEGADLIVVGSTHRGRLGRAVAGSTASQIVGHAPCAVAVAPRGFTGERLERIGVGFDGRPESEEALRVAAALAGEHGATLHLRGVVVAPMPVYGNSWGDFAYADVATWDEFSRLERGRLKDAERDALERLDVTAWSDVVDGDPVSQLTRLSAHVDALVLGSRGWGPLSRLIVGSVAEAVLREASCPVIVVPRTGRES